MTSEVEEAYQALVQFLYIAPIGLMQTRLNGLIKRADAAMYTAKANSRNRVERWNAGLRHASGKRLPA